LKIWRVGWGWWGVVALVQPALLVAVALAYNGLGGNPGLAFGGQVTAVEFIVQVVMLAIATLGEEIGWRGFALPALLKTRSALTASLILGTVWSAWHIPFWLLQDSLDRYGPGYLIINFLMIIPMTVYITWFFKHTRGSILLAAVFHLTFNIVNVVVVPVTSLIEPYLAFVAVQWVVALLLIWRYGHETLARDLISGT
jgi:membrane protease YdiL (CAAX protease family)